MVTKFPLGSHGVLNPVCVVASAPRDAVMAKMVHVFSSGLRNIEHGRCSFDQLLRMPHSVQKVLWYKVYGEVITCTTY